VTAGDTANAADLFLPDCFVPGAAEDIYRLVLAEPQDLLAVATADAGSALLPALALYEDCAAGTGLIRCVLPEVQATSVATLSWARLPAGSYGLLVGAATGWHGAGAPGAYRLDTTLSPPSPPQGGDGCADAPVLDLDGGPYDLSGDTTGAGADLILPCTPDPGAGPDLVFRVTNTAGREVAYEFSPWPGFEAAIALYDGACGGEAPGEFCYTSRVCDARFYAPESNDLWFVVAGDDAGQSGEFRLWIAPR